MWFDSSENAWIPARISGKLPFRFFFQIFYFLKKISVIIISIKFKKIQQYSILVKCYYYNMCNGEME